VPILILTADVGINHLTNIGWSPWTWYRPAALLPPAGQTASSSTRLIDSQPARAASSVSSANDQMKSATRGQHRSAANRRWLLQALTVGAKAFGLFTPLPKQEIVIGKFAVKAMPGFHSARRKIIFNVSCGLGLTPASSI